MELSNTKNRQNSFEFVIDKMQVHILSSRDEMGKKAAEDTASKIKELLFEKNELNIVFAAAPSQNEFLYYLSQDTSIQWDKINAFHMDEYIGLHKDAPQTFGNFLKDRIFSKLDFKTVNYIDGTAINISKECQRYEKLLLNNPVDIVCLGIGENGHIAFNDPPVANFNDPLQVKDVELDLSCRQQQVNENCFDLIHHVPTRAITLTVPALLKAQYLFCIVPSGNKAKAVYNTIHSEISEKCPATILRSKENTTLYLDQDSAKLIIARA